MSRIINWAVLHGVSPQALAELREILGIGEPEYTGGEPGKRSEARVQELIRLKASKNGCIMWRNSVGALKDDRGALIRYGLCNDSKALNTNVKSSDLIGITPIEISEKHLGHILGVFTAVEVKKPNWKFRENDKRAVAQMKFGEIVMSRGGIFMFANDENEYEKSITKSR